MHQISDAWLAHQRRRFTRHDAHRWRRCDAARYRRFDPRFQRGRLRFEDKAWADQPRVPAGSPEGGQWTGGDGTTPVRHAGLEKPLTAILAAALRLGMRMIQSYRKQNLIDADLIGNKLGTAAVTQLDDKHVFGFNSGISEFAGVYTDTDDALATQFRDTMIAKHPDVMSTDNIGRVPNNALFHAEGNVLLRAWKENGGTLEGVPSRTWLEFGVARSPGT